MKVSIVIPIHDTPLTPIFLRRAIDSVRMQAYRDYEIVITQEGKMAENTNAGIKKAKGDIIKILYMDDYLSHPNALQNIVDNFNGGWLITSCIHEEQGQLKNPHHPQWNSKEEMLEGRNTLGGPSVLAFENKDPLLFDERLSWLLDCELYARLFDRYGEPTIVNDIGIVIGLGEHQMTHILSDTDKLNEHKLINEQ